MVEPVLRRSVSIMIGSVLISEPSLMAEPLLMESFLREPEKGVGGVTRDEERHTHGDQPDAKRKKEQTNLYDFEMIKQIWEDRIKNGNSELEKVRRKIEVSSQEKATAESEIDKYGQQTDQHQVQGVCHQVLNSLHQ